MNWPFFSNLYGKPDSRGGLAIPMKLYCGMRDVVYYL
jgi:hypothetical protein